MGPLSIQRVIILLFLNPSVANFILLNFGSKMTSGDKALRLKNYSFKTTHTKKWKMSDALATWTILRLVKNWKSNSMHLFFVAVFYKLLCFEIDGKILFLEFWALKQHFYLLTLISTATQKISEVISIYKKNPEFHILENL